MKRFRGTFPALAIAALAAAQDDPDEARAVFRVDTEHYALRLQGLEEEGARYGKLLELAWPRFREVVRAEPKREDGARLRIELRDDRDQCLEAAMADAADMPPIQHPAWFSRGNGRVYLYRHESEWVTRYLLLYAAFLQFHGLAKPKNVDLDTWYAHGLAESLATHAFDGERLELATSPAIAPLDHPAIALAELGGKHLGLDPFTEARLANPSVRWAVVRFATTGPERYRKRFEKLALGHTGSKVSGADFLRSLGAESRIAQEFAAWLLGNQQPFVIVQREWEVLPGGSILATPVDEGVALCALEPPFDTLEATFAAPGPGSKGPTATIVLSLQDANDYVQARPVPPLVFVEHVRSGNMYAMETLKLGATRPLLRVRVTTREFRAALEIDGEAFPPIEVPKGRPGLAATRGPVTFAEVRWR